MPATRMRPSSRGRRSWRRLAAYLRRFEEPGLLRRDANIIIDSDGLREFETPWPECQVTSASD
jgi:hypothetical protein